jgi:membrane AbrB-like protein
MRWALLIGTAALVAVFHLVGLPAAFLLGAMAMAMVVAARGATLAVPPAAFDLAQAVIGCLIARSFTPAIFRSIGERPVLFAATVLSVLLVATVLGLVLARMRVLPGSTALWGSYPGAATAMVVLSQSYGADMRLVAIMQYLRVVAVASTASLVARLWGLGGAAPHHAWLPPIAWPSLAVTAGLVLAGGLVAPRLRIPGGAILLPLAAGALVQDLAHVPLELPPILLAASYLVIGWAIGVRFSRDALAGAARALPRVLASIATLIVSCAGIGWALSRIGGIDPLTAYLATSPGGADSVAIIAAGARVDVAFVMTIQVGRFCAILLFGSTLARLAARLASPPPGAPSRAER